MTHAVFKSWKLWKTETFAQKRWKKWYFQLWRRVRNTQEQRERTAAKLVKEGRLLEELMTEKQMFSVHKHLDLIWCISKHLWVPAHSWFLSFFVCCCCREAGEAGEASVPPTDAAQPFFPFYNLFPPLPPNQRLKYRLNCCQQVCPQFGVEKVLSFYCLLRTLVVKLEVKHNKLLSFLQASSRLSTT